MKKLQVGLEQSPFTYDEGEMIGRDPRQISGEQWLEIQRDFPVGLDAVRAKCLDCSHTPGEVRKCVCVNCPLWPFRMGAVPKGYRQARNKGGNNAP